MNDVWADVWRRLDNVLAAVARNVVAKNSTVSWRAGHYANAAFPLRAWLSFSRQPGDEDLVISIDFKRSNRSIEVSTDIARGDGYVVAQGPIERIDISADQDHFRNAILDAERASKTFLQAQTDLIAGELSR